MQQPFTPEKEMAVLNAGFTGG